jgi:hypothetical protein
MKTKLFLFAIVAVFAAMVVSCGPNKEEQKKKAMEDSIKKVDSIANLFVGTWREENKITACPVIKITKAGNVFTLAYNFCYVNSSDLDFASPPAAYIACKLDGQSLITIEAGGEPASIIENGKILYKGVKFTRFDLQKAKKYTDSLDAIEKAKENKAVDEANKYFSTHKKVTKEQKN